MSSESRISPFRHLGLRARIITMFTAGALGFALLLSFSAVTISRSNLLTERENLVLSRVRANAAVLENRLNAPQTDAQTLFGSLSVAGRPSALIADASVQPDGFRPVSLDTKYGANTIPVALRDTVDSNGQIAIMRYQRDGETLVAAGAPLGNNQGVYFEVATLDDIERSLSGLGTTLLVTSGAIAVLGALLGYWTSKRALRPLADIAQVAQSVSLGKLDARLAYAEWAEDRDLAPLLSSFNEMFSTLQHRIDRDARFASDVSHELRSPLTTFNASLEVLRNAQEEMPERAQLALDLLSSDMERFTQLVEDLLEISRFDAGAVRLDLTEVLIVEAVQMTVRSLVGTGLRVDADESLGDLVILCDKRRLVRVLANFIDNATKYGDGVIRVSINRVSVADEDVTVDPVHPENPPLRDVLHIGVEDAGPGVPAAEREKIFDRFSRGALGGSRGSDLGVGLGLALAAEHARLQQGSVWVEDRPSGEPGARFVIELPVIEPTEDDNTSGEYA